MLVGNKLDLIDSGHPREVSTIEAARLAATINAQYFETSTRSQKQPAGGVGRVMQAIAERLVRLAADAGERQLTGSSSPVALVPAGTGRTGQEAWSGGGGGELN